MADFERLGVAPELIELIQVQGWMIPTPVQDEAIPLILGGGDVCVAAETGSGKTGSFVIPCVQLVHETLRNKASCHVTRNFTDLTVTQEQNSLTVSSSIDRWSGMKLSNSVLSSRGMFEATILSEGLVRVGFGTRSSTFEVGKDNESFGYGGTGKKSFNGVFSDYGTPFGNGDTIGCMIDRDNHIIQFAKNGINLGTAFEIPNPLRNVDLFPAVCGRLFKLSVRTTEPFQYPILGYCGITRNSPQCETDNSKHKTLCLILEPTKELARQTFDVVNHYAMAMHDIKMKSALLIGGVRDAKDMARLKKKGATIVVGTIGKVHQAMVTQTIDLSRLQYFVLDEADELISQDVTHVLTQLKRASTESRVQTLFFSATLDLPQVRSSIDTLTKNATWVNLKGKLGIPETVHFITYTVDATANTVPCESKFVSPHIIPPTDGVHHLVSPSCKDYKEQMVSEDIKRRKPQIALAIADALDMSSCLIFCRTNLDCDNFEHYINEIGRQYGSLKRR